MNLYTLHNDTLTVTLDACGAVLHSIVKDGAEYLWQGNARYWARRDANLFPYVGRLTDGQYLLDGKTYPMTIHGFCIGTDFAVTEQTDSSIRFTLRSNEKTLSMYPFHFAFHVCYTLRGNQIRKTCLVENRDSREMYFGIGGHPGFNVPLNGEGSFEDWELDFAEPCQPVRVDMDPANYRLAGTEISLSSEKRPHDPPDPCAVRSGRGSAGQCQPRIDPALQQVFPQRHGVLPGHALRRIVARAQNRCPLRLH